MFGRGHDGALGVGLGHDDDDQPVLKDVRWPNPDREAREDAKPCEHYLWQEGR